VPDRSHILPRRSAEQPTILAAELGRTLVPSTSTAAPAPVRRYLPKLIELVLDKKINPGKVSDLTLPLDQVAEGYKAMDERRAIKVLLQP
jgi:threonine dehydrogenase-like Zn-dependent dehydrogenase